jgi:cytochrome c oxidase subunit II
MLSKAKRLAVMPFCVGVMLGFFPVLAGAAEWPLNMTEGVTTVSHEIYGLHMQIFWWCVWIGVVVFGVMLYTMIMHRKSIGAKPANFHENTTLELIWTVIPIIILVVMAFPATRTLVKVYDTKDTEMDILITGYQWKWKYEYLQKSGERGENVSFFSVLSTPKEQIANEAEKGPNYLLEVDEPVYIPTGKRIRFLVTAVDVIHSWWVPALAIKRDAIPGYIHEAWTQVDEPGTFRGQCAELCGRDHGFMPIVVKAVPQAEFDAWLNKKKAAAVEVAEAAKQTFDMATLVARGQEVYDKNCSACHMPNGEGVAGSFPAIAGSKIANGPVADHLNRIIHGGGMMPPFGEQLTPVDIAAVATFQRNSFGNKMGDLVQPIDVVKAKQGQ